MVDHEMKTEEKLSQPEEDYLPPKQFDLMRRYSRDEGFREYLSNLQKDVHRELHQVERNMSIQKNEKPDDERIRKMLSGLSFELLNSSQSETECVSLRKQINDLEFAYKNVMEKFLQKMEQFLYSCKELREDLQKTREKFHAISRLTAEVTLASSVMEVALLMGSALHKIFDFGWNPNIPFLATFIGSISIATALFALSYMRQSTADISKEVKDENRFLLDLVILHRRGNWIDDDVLNLFPYGIDLKLLDETELKNKAALENKMSWRHYLCSVIILTNIQKDEKLLKDEIFLTKVKMFLRSQAAEIWWNRRKIKRLLDDILKKVNAISIKEFTADHEVHFKRTALYLYPVMIPFLLNSWNSGRMRFFFSSLALLLTSSILLTNRESEESEELKKILNKFEKDFKEITEICETLDNDYD